MGKNRLAYAMFALFLIAFLLITAKGLMAAQPGDENVYYYMAKLASEGKVPYRDFFYAHPPLHIYLLAGLYKLFGLSIPVFKSLALVSTLISSFFVFKIAREKFGALEAVLSCTLFLFSYSVMFNSVFSFGVDVAAMFLIIGCYALFVRHNYLIAGVFFGLASLTRLLALIPIFTILAITLVSSRKKFMFLSSVFFTVFLISNAALLLMFGNSYFIPVYKYHLLKSPESASGISEYFGIIKLNFVLFLSFLAILLVKDKKPAMNFAVISIAYLLFLLSLKKIFGFYFIIAFPLIAIVGGYCIANILRNLKSKKLKIFMSSLIILIFIWDLSANIMFLQQSGFEGFERGKDLADFINSHSKEGTLLFGDDSVVPLLALLTGKRIAMEFVDTNNEVFLTNSRNLSQTLENLNGKDLLFVVRTTQGISSFAEVREFLNRKCDLLSRFQTKTEGGYMVYECNLT